MVDKNLFLHDLAVVTIMKIDGPYVKEWLDYHLLAGVDHFYIYDNESVDEYRDVIKPYVKRGIVTSIPTSVWQGGKPAYNESVKKFKFHCRYMAFIDSDEFIFPKNNKSIVEVLDSLFSHNPDAGTLAVHWQCFGSNGEEKADYTQGVLDRFTKRAQSFWYSQPNNERTEWTGNIHVKNIANPRKINFFRSPHFPDCFAGVNTIDDNGKTVSSSFIKFPITVNTLVLNHYYTKSHEEFLKRRPASSGERSKFFPLYDRNEVFDDGILKYRVARQAATGGVESLFAKNQINFSRLYNALAQNLFMTTAGTLPRNFYDERIENFLTCLNLSGYLRGKVLDNDGAKIFEELSLNALYKSLHARFSIADILLLLRELPKILELNYPSVKNILDACIKIIPQIMTTYQNNGYWQGIAELENILELLKKIK